MLGRISSPPRAPSRADRGAFNEEWLPCFLSLGRNREAPWSTVIRVDIGHTKRHTKMEHSRGLLEQLLAHTGQGVYLGDDPSACPEFLSMLALSYKCRRTLSYQTGRLSRHHRRWDKSWVHLPKQLAEFLWHCDWLIHRLIFSSLLFNLTDVCMRIAG